MKHNVLNVYEVNFFFTTMALVTKNLIVYANHLKSFLEVLFLVFDWTFEVLANTFKVKSIVNHFVLVLFS